MGRCPCPSLLLPAAVIVDAVRTAPRPAERRACVTGIPSTWSAEVLRALVERNDLDPAAIDDVIAGCVSQTGEQALNVARNAALAAGFPESVPGTTVDRQCGSSQQAIHFAAQGVMAGAYDVVVAAGVESMTRVPMGSAILNGPGLPFGPQVAQRYLPAGGLVPQGHRRRAGRRAWGLTRDDLDAYSLREPPPGGGGHRRGPVRRRDRARHGRHHPGEAPSSTPTRASAATPAWRRWPRSSRRSEDAGTVTAGNSSQISDGAAAVLIMSEDRAAALGLAPRARLVAFAVVGVDPVIMLTAPIPATTAVLAGRPDPRRHRPVRGQRGVRLGGAGVGGRAPADMDRVNVNGGAIALGHPLGCSGARLTATLLGELERSGGRYGLQTMCEGGGMANAMILERLGTWRSTFLAQAGGRHRRVRRC